MHREGKTYVHNSLRSSFFISYRQSTKPVSSKQPSSQDEPRTSVLLNPGPMPVIDQPLVWEEEECEGVGATEEGYAGWDVSRESHDQREVVSLGDQGGRCIKI